MLKGRQRQDIKTKQENSILKKVINKSKPIEISAEKSPHPPKKPPSQLKAPQPPLTRIKKAPQNHLHIAPSILLITTLLPAALQHIAHG